MSNLLKTRLNKKGLRYAPILLMNLITLPLIIGWTIIGMVLFLLAFFFMKFVQGYSTSFLTRKCIWIYGRVWQFMLSPFVIFTLQKIHGQPFKNPGIIVVNHRSFFDTYCMNMMPICDVCFAVRAWPFKIPFFIWPSIPSVSAYFLPIFCLDKAVFKGILRIER